MKFAWETRPPGIESAFDPFGAFTFQALITIGLVKKLLVGCLVIVVLAAVVLGVGSYFLYRAATPYIEDARSYFREMSELGEIEKGITNTTPYEPPASRELTQPQVERFARVQEQVRAALGQRMAEFEEKYKHLKSDGSGNAQPSFTEVIAGLRDLAGVLPQARRYQVEALNKEQFSQQEYSWVRARVFQAAGVEVANMIDLSQIERAVREGTGMKDFEAPKLPESDIPAKNRELVKPYMKQMDQWIPLTFFGL